MPSAEYSAGLFNASFAEAGGNGAPPDHKKKRFTAIGDNKSS